MDFGEDFWKDDILACVAKLEINQNTGIIISSKDFGEDFLER